MASILSDNININPTLDEIGVPVTVVFMASEAYEYLHTANWPRDIRWVLRRVLFNTAERPTIKEFQKCARNIENCLRSQILKCHIDTIRDELDTFVGTIFKDVCIFPVPEQDGIYYFYNGKNKLILIVAVTRPNGSNLTGVSKT